MVFQHGWFAVANRLAEPPDMSLDVFKTELDILLASDCECFLRTCQRYVPCSRMVHGFTNSHASYGAGAAVSAIDNEFLPHLRLDICKAL